MPLAALCRAEEVAEDTPVQAEHAGIAYAVFTKDGAFYVTQDTCTHGPGALSEGWVEGREVECPFHQGRFDFTTGLPTAAPCIEALRTWTARVEDGAVCIDPDEVRP